MAKEMILTIGIDVAATGLKQLYGRLVAGNAVTKAQKKVFEQLGLDAQQVAKSMVNDGEGTIIRVLERIKQLPKHLQAATIKQLFGDEALDSITGLSEKVGDLKKNLEGAKSEMSANAVEKEYANRMDTPANTLKVSKNKVMNSLAKVGEALAPTINKILEWLSPLLDKFSKWIKKNPELTSGIMKIVGAFSILSIMLGGFQYLLTPLLRLFNSFNTIFETIKILKFGK